MPKKRTSVKKKSFKLPFLVLFLISLGAVVALARYVQMGHRLVPQDERRQTAADQTSEPIVRPSRGHRETPRRPLTDDQSGPFVFKPSMEGGKLTFEKEPVTVPDDEDPKVYVLNQFLQESKIVQPNARLLSVDLHDGVAALSFTQEMDQTYGTDDESTLLNGILANMGQFPEVKSVLFYAQGKQIDTFGDVDLSEKQDVIRP